MVANSKLSSPALILILAAASSTQAACHLLFDFERAVPSSDRNLGSRETGAGAELGRPVEWGGRRDGSANPVPQTKTIAGVTWKLVWSDEFTGPTLDTTRWTAANDSGSGQELQCFHEDDVIIDQAQGWLRLRARRNTCVDDDGVTRSYTTGKVSTQGKWWTQFGRIEVRARAAKGEGVQSKLELNSARGWYPMGFDLFETRGQEPTSLYLTYRWDNGGVKKQPNLRSTAPNLTDNFHEIVAQWEPGKIAWYLDGQQLPFGPAGMDAINTHPMYLRFRATVGGWAGDPTSTSFPQYFDLDYVRVYQRADLPDPSTNTLLNGSFEEAGTSGPEVINSWYLPWDVSNFTNTGPVRDTTVAAPGSGTASLRVDVKQLSPGYKEQLSYRPLRLKKGHAYRMTFQARATVNRVITVYFDRDYSPYENVCLPLTAKLTATWTAFTFSCTPIADEWPAAVRFDFGTPNTDELGTVWIDAVSLALPP